MLVSVEGSTVCVSGPKRSIPNGLVCKDRRDSEAARRDHQQNRELMPRKTAKDGKGGCQLGNSTCKPRLQKCTGRELTKVSLKKTDNAIICKSR